MENAIDRKFSKMYNEITLRKGTTLVRGIPTENGSLSYWLPAETKEFIFLRVMCSSLKNREVDKVLKVYCKSNEIKVKLIITLNSEIHSFKEDDLNKQELRLNTKNCDIISGEWLLGYLQK